MGITLNGSSYLTRARSGITFPRTFFCWVKAANDSQTSDFYSLAQAGGNDAIGAGMETFKARARTLGSGGGSSIGVTNDILTSWQPCMVRFDSAADRWVRYGSGSAVSESFSVSTVAGDFDRCTVGAYALDLTRLFTGDIAEVTEWSADKTGDWATLAAGGLPESLTSGLVEHHALLTGSDLTGTNGGVFTASGTITTSATHPITRSSATIVPIFTQHRRRR